MLARGTKHTIPSNLSGGSQPRPKCKLNSNKPSYRGSRRIDVSAVKRLVLMRHAESEQFRTGIRDHDRSISDSGVQSARAVAKHLSEVSWIPELLLCSNSRRTKQTIDAMNEAFFDHVKTFTPDVHFLGTLYTIAALDGMTKGHLLSLLRERAQDHQQTVMCVGHNQGWSEAASAFSQVRIRLTNSTAALLQTKASSWQDATEEDRVWELVGVVTDAGFQPWNEVTAGNHTQN